MKHRFKSIMAAIMILLIVLGIAAYIVVPQVAAEGKDYAGELQDLQEERKQLENRLNQIENKRDAELEKKGIIDQQINNLQSEIDISESRLANINDELEIANNELEIASEKYNTAFEEAKKYIRISYESGSVSYLEIILSSKGITDFITRVEIVTEIMDHQQKALGELKQSRDKIEATQKQILSKQQEQQKVTDGLNSRRNELVSKQKSSDRIVERFNEKEDELNVLLEEVERQEAELQEEIRNQLAQEGNVNVPISNGFRYPLDSNWKIITSRFGYRVHPTTGVYKLHTGVDISGSGIHGANIYASKNGSVSKAGYHNAYGNYCLINHGDGTATLYAHMSTLLTSAGSIVTQGQVIGKVGSTGYSTGAHLHFEILINGEYVDPVPYFSSSINFIYS